MRNCFWFKAASISVVLFLLSSGVFPGRALAWGATTRTPGVCTTHQSILREAYKLLKADPAFEGSQFPKDINSILAYEGMAWQTNFTWDLVGSSPYDLLGPGPDDETKTKWSDHFYNPETDEGGAPAAAEKYFTELCNAQYKAETNKQANSSKGAAWSAHFLSDMYVPYHIIGMPGEEAKARDKAGEYLLDEKVTGPSFLYGLPTNKDLPSNGWGGGGNFTHAIRRFVKYANDSGPQAQRDWCDPWYLNGWWIGDAKFLKSSHVNYEVLAFEQFKKWDVYPFVIIKSTEPFSSVHDTEIPAWQNEFPTWDTVIKSQASQVEKHSKAAAKLTREKIKEFWEKPDQALYHAVESVYTMWRASISALKPQAKIDLISSNRYRVVGSIGNVAEEEAKEVEARLTVISGGRLTGNNIQVIGVVGKESKPVAWEIESTNIRQCKMKMEIIGHYELTPDLQYAFTEPVIGNITQPVNPPKPTPTPTRAATPTPTRTYGPPVVTYIAGGGTHTVIKDGKEQPYDGGTLISINVKPGGKEPYTYEVVGNGLVLSETRGGTGVQLGVKLRDFNFDGKVYRIFITVKDGNGQLASYGGAGGSKITKFTFGLKYDPGEKTATGKVVRAPSWVPFTEPVFPY